MDNDKKRLLVSERDGVLCGGTVQQPLGLSYGYDACVNFLEQETSARTSSVKAADTMLPYLLCSVSNRSESQAW